MKVILPDLPDILLCSNFSDYFSDKIKLIYDNLKTLNKQLPDIQLYYEYSILTPTLMCFRFPPLLRSIILLLHPHFLHHQNPIHLQTLKKLASTIAPIYKRLIDESLITGIIPSDLTYSIISPLIKKTT